jgi:hypothetical protein
VIPAELEFRENGRLLLGTFVCRGEPGLLKSGKRGWLAVSRHLDWRCGWCLKLHCPVTEAAQRPPDRQREFTFDPNYCGRLVVDDGRVTAYFRVPDCLDPPGKKSFNWRAPILFGEQMFNFQLRLEMRPPRGDASYLRRRAATRFDVGGIEFVSPNVTGDTVLGYVPDSEAGRGRKDRISAFVHEHRSEYVVGEPYTDARGNTVQNIDSLQHLRLVAKGLEFVDRHPSSADKA